MANGLGLLGAGFVERNLLALPASLLVWTAQAVEIPCSGSDNKNGGGLDTLSVTKNGTFSLSKIDTSALFVLSQGEDKGYGGNGAMYAAASH
jgi:hypothetical protein